MHMLLFQGLIAFFICTTGFGPLCGLTDPFQKSIQSEKNQEGLRIKKHPSSTPAPSSYKYELAICAIFQNEAPYLREWIEYHKLVGVQHFYLFNNFSSDNYAEILQPYISEGEVELYDWCYAKDTLKEWARTQFSAYEQGLSLARGIAKWVAVIDLDEFIVPVKHKNIVDFLKSFEEFGGVCINWQLFGTGGVDKIPDDQLLIETLIRKAPDHYHLHGNVKSIVRPERVVGCNNPHFFEYAYGSYQVNANKEAFKGQSTKGIFIDKIRINHYWSRDLEYFYNVKLPRHSKWGDRRDLCIQIEKDSNMQQNFTILRFVPALRERLGFAPVW